MSARRNARTWQALLLTVAAVGVAAVAGFASGARVAARAPRLDAEASRAAFLQVYKVFTSPRCQNCHPAGDAPLQGDDSHIHMQNVKRGRDGHGVYGMRCDTCHQSTNLPGAHMPPGNPKWSLPPAEHQMIFVGRTPAELCRQLKDPQQTGGRSLAQLLEHVLSRAETTSQMKTWIDGAAACPE